MCSNSCECQPEKLSIPVEIEVIEPVCQKCRQDDAEIVLRKRHRYCKTCFLTMTTHKFKAALGKAKMIRRGDPVLLVHSGKANSTALLQLVKLNAQESNTDGLSFVTTVLYVDDGGAKGRSVEERQSIMQSLADQLSKFGFPGYTTSLTQNSAVQNLSTAKIEDDDSIVRTFENLDLTTRKELLRQLRGRAIKKAAYELNCKKILLAENSMDLAKTVFNDVALGRGAQIPFDVTLFDTRHPDVVLLRPMREFTVEEVSHYLKFYNLHPVRCEKPRKSRASIQTATKRFMENLDGEYSGTVSTIFRTGDKLGKISQQENAETCLLCNGILDMETTEELNALKAIEFSRVTSSGITLEAEKSSAERKSLNNTCYSCTCVIRNIESSGGTDMLNSLQKDRCLSNMRKEISDFLL